MNMKTIKIFLFVTLTVTFSCSDFLEENPKSTANSQSVLSSVAGFDAVLVGAYSNLTGWGKMYTWDVLKLNESFVDFQYAPQAPDISNGNIISSDYPVRFAWENLYKIISSANLVIVNINRISEDPNRDRIEGEAKFLRAWAYFNLVQFFGDVPLTLEPINDPSNFQPTRTAQPEVYELIISDLQAAESLMGDDAPQPSRVTKWVAKAYLAKVYLTMAGNPNNIDTFNGTNTYELALEKAREVINSNKFSIDVSYKDVFLSNGDPETIWEIRSPDLPNYNHYNFLSQAIFTPTSDFINSFDPTDIRGSRWGIRTSYDYNGTTYTFPLPTYMKFVDTVQYAKGQQFQSALAVTVIRLADVYLMASEADNEVNNGPSAEAYNWINLVRDRAGISDLVNLSESDFREAVFLERRKELYGEGFSWFDLKRRNKFNLLNNTGRPFVTPIDVHLNYYPIYNAETINNPNVTQNPGWPG